MKSILKSKTFWFNLVAGAAAVLGAVPVTPWTAAGAAVANIILRAITNQPVSVPGMTPTPQGANK